MIIFFILLGITIWVVCGILAFWLVCRQEEYMEDASLYSGDLLTFCAMGCIALVLVGVTIVDDMTKEFAKSNLLHRFTTFIYNIGKKTEQEKNQR